MHCFLFVLNHSEAHVPTDVTAFMTATLPQMKTFSIFLDKFF